jgi:hypothetical protein
MKVAKLVYHPQKVLLNDRPTLLEEEVREAIRARSLITRQKFDGKKNFLLGEGVPQVLQVRVFKDHGIPIKIPVSRLSSSHDRGEMGENNMLLGVKKTKQASLVLSLFCITQEN